MSISVQDVALLRKKTGAGIMDCKKSLIEAEGDFERAIDLLRKKGQKIFTDRADRNASEGAVFASVCEAHKEAFLLVLSCETDFVAKNTVFLELGDAILQAAMLHKPTSVEALHLLPLSKGTVQEAILSAISAIGEKITISTYETLQGEAVVAYIHAGNKLGVLVALAGAQGETVWHAGKDVAMQIAAMQPVAVDKDQVDNALIERELIIIREQVMQEGHSGDKAEKITEGRLNKFFQESTLLSQPFIKNNKLTVAQYLKEISPNLTLVAFKRVAIHA